MVDIRAFIRKNDIQGSRLLSFRTNTDKKYRLQKEHLFEGLAIDCYPNGGVHGGGCDVQNTGNTAHLEDLINVEGLTLHVRFHDDTPYGPEWPGE